MPRSGHNPKRKIRPLEAALEDEQNLAEQCRYVGSPYHKRNPGDYDLTPPAAPRPGKTLCDASGPISKDVAQQLLRSAFERGLVSIRHSNNWPETVWAVSDADEVFEAQLDNHEQGTYHGYPLQANDPFREEVLKEWKGRVN